MLEIIKFGTNKFGVWIVGHYVRDNIDLIDIFNTNLKDESVLKDKTTIQPKKLKISKNKDKQIVFKLEF